MQSATSAMRSPTRKDAEQSVESGEDDAQLIDSLFGPKDGGTSKKDNILTGFQGLSLDEGLGSDMWGKEMAQPWNSNPQGSSSLLASIQTDVHHPSQSRFGWGEKEGGN